ncbi:MAG: hypothetical protein P9M02_00795 [Candidatus Susulua stagnicola]|nr:hypothetical protein [Candidatus Susulua stagnicola]
MVNKTKTLFLVLIVNFIICLLSGSQGLLAKTKKEPSREIKQIYNELKLKINQLEKKTTHPQNLKNAERKIKVLSSLIDHIQPEIKPETGNSRTKVELTPNTRALIEKKRNLQTEIHTADFPLEALKEKLAELLEEKESLEAEYLLAQIETLILSEATSALNKEEIIIQGKIELGRPDDISIILSLGRSMPATAFCEVYLNDVFIRRQHWKIGSKEEFEIKITSSDKVKPLKGLNDIMIILNTTYQNDDIVLQAPGFRDNPLTIFNQSKITARTLLSTNFELKPKKQKKQETIAKEEKEEVAKESIKKDPIDNNL